jgi:hypothetical protein
MREGGVSCGQKRLPEKAESSKTKPLKHRGKEEAEERYRSVALGIFLLQDFAAIYIQRIYSSPPPFTPFLRVSRVSVPV